MNFQQPTKPQQLKHILNDLIQRLGSSEAVERLIFLLHSTDIAKYRKLLENMYKGKVDRAVERNYDKVVFMVLYEDFKFSDVQVAQEYDIKKDNILRRSNIACRLIDSNQDCADFYERCTKIHSLLKLIQQNGSKSSR